MVATVASRAATSDTPDDRVAWHPRSGAAHVSILGTRDLVSVFKLTTWCVKRCIRAIDYFSSFRWLRAGLWNGIPV